MSEAPGATNTGGFSLPHQHHTTRARPHARYPDGTCRVLHVPGPVGKARAVRGVELRVGGGDRQFTTSEATQAVHIDIVERALGELVRSRDCREESRLLVDAHGRGPVRAVMLTGPTLPRRLDCLLRDAGQVRLFDAGGAGDVKLKDAPGAHCG